MFKQPKIRIDIYLEATDLNILSRYARERGLKNYSHAITEIFKEWRRFKMIALELQKQSVPKEAEEIKNAKIIKEK